MAEIIECPRCQRKLRMADSILGQSVICPACQLAFTAELPNRAAPSPAPPRADDEPYRPVSDEPPPRRYDDDVAPRRRDRYEDDDYPRRRGRDDDEDYPRSRRSRFGDYQRPHRGSQIQTLGILSIVLMCFPLPALILAIVTISMAVSDLSAMGRGDMDDSGRTQTKTGLICAIIGPMLVGLVIFAICGLNILGNM
jgi:hypothetical protein